MHCDSCRPEIERNMLLCAIAWQALRAGCVVFVYSWEQILINWLKKWLLFVFGSLRSLPRISGRNHSSKKMRPSRWIDSGRWNAPGPLPNNYIPVALPLNGDKQYWLGPWRRRARH